MTTTSSPLLVRADASTGMGTGHVMRCLALAQIWREKKGEVYFAMAHPTAALHDRLAREGIDLLPIPEDPGSLEDANLTAKLGRKCHATWCVLDGYHFSRSYRKRLHTSGSKLLFIDDIGQNEQLFCDVLLNQNPHAVETLYPEAHPSTRLLLGPRHALLRSEFRRWSEWTRSIPERARNVLLSMGGEDPEKMTLFLLRAIEHVAESHLNVVVVIGGNNTGADEIRHAARTSKHSVRVECNVLDMSNLMTWADVAVAAAGSTCWELACLGLPSLLVAVAENQRPILKQMAEKGASISLGWHTDISLENVGDILGDILRSATVRSQMAAAGRALVDGEGAQRVFDVMREVGGI